MTVYLPNKKSKSKFLNISLFISLFLYSFFGILFTTYHIDSFRIPQVIGFIVFIIVIWNFIKSYFRSSQSNILFSLFILWQIFILIRVDNLSIDETRLILFEPIHFLSYLIPFVFFLPITVNSLSKKFEALFFFSLAFMLLHFFLISENPINNFTDTIALSSLAPVGIVLLLSKYVSKKILIGAFLIVVSILFIGLVYGRRSVILNALMLLLFSFGINILINKKINFGFKFLFILVSIIVFVFLIDFFLTNADENSFQIFNRIDTDSRSFVIDAFVKDFKSIDYLIGRGIDGTYYNPMKYWNFSDDDYRDVVYRTNIENGFLYIIMKGGIIYLLLFLLILFRAIYLGFFKSKNLLIKGLASYLFIYFVDMFAYGQPSFSIKYCLVWICISLCYSRNFRNINEKELIGYFDSDKKSILNNSINI